MEQLTDLLESINDRNTANRAASTILALTKRLETLRETLAHKNKPAENMHTVNAIIKLSSKCMIQLQRIIMASCYGSEQLENIINEISK